MRTNRLNLMLGLGVLVAAALACNYTTANISSLKVSKEKGGQETNSFAATDTVYAAAEVSNAPGKLKAKGRLVADEVEGMPSGPVPGAETTLDLPGSATATFTFTPPGDGWPKGKYKVEVLMLTEEGEQKDQKSTNFTVGG